jgi:hypothetical protein
MVWLFLVVPFAGITKTNDEDSLSVKRKMLFRGYYQNGKVFKTNDFLRYNSLTKDDVDRFHAVSVQALWQTNGEHEWEKEFGYPRLGVGVWTAQFFDAPNLGTPLALYGLFNAPFIKYRKWSWNYELEMGMVFNWKDFNPLTNSQNIAIGADQSVYLDLGTYFEYRISPKLSLELGASLSHFSNGALKLPNLGINTFAPKFILQYHPSETKYAQTKIQTNIDFSKYELLVTSYYGVKNVLYKGSDIDSISKYKGVYFPQTGILTTFNRALGQKSKIGIGFGLGYNGSANAQILIDEAELEEKIATFNDGFELSIFPSYEFAVERVSIIFQYGFYLYRTKYEGRRPNDYQRIGIKYHFTPDIYVGFNLKAYDYYRSDYIEWNIGYRFQW